jgi:hypothetical protein
MVLAISQIFRLIFLLFRQMQAAYLWMQFHRFFLFNIFFIFPSNDGSLFIMGENGVCNFTDISRELVKL